ncbi:hypothetical protein AALC17_18565 [Oscillospiraceae bacterium 38-13]
MLREYARRVVWLVGGLLVSAVGITMMLQADVGLEPWSVLQQGIAQTFGITYGVSSILVGAAVILIAIACGERVGLGTVANIFLCGIFIDTLLALGWIPRMEALLPGVLMLLGGLELLALGTWMYMKSALGSGPRDALMVAMARRTGRSVGLCRAVVELVIIVVGWRLGGRVGLGTVISALGLGTLFNLNFALLRFDAAALHQEDLAETLRRLRGEARKQPEETVR